MVSLISRLRGGLAALKLTKLFGSDDFPAAKNSGKVLIIIIYCYLIIVRLSFLSGEKYLNKIFVLFSGSESDELSLNLTFESRELSVKMTPAEDLFKFNPSSRLDFQSI